MHMYEANTLGVLGTLLNDRIGAACDDLSPSAAALLLTLHYRPGLTTTELARIAGVAQPTAVRVLDGMVRSGFVRRGAKSGRVAPVFLSPAGGQKAESIQKARLEAMAGLMECLTQAEQAQFLALTQKILGKATISRAFARTTCRLCAHNICPEGNCTIGNAADRIERAAGQEGYLC